MVRTTKISTDQSYDKVETWKKLDRMIVEMFDQKEATVSFMDLYRSSYTMVVSGDGEIVYNGLKTRIDDQMTKTAEKLSRALSTNFSTELCNVWSIHKPTILMIRDILMFVERDYADSQKLPTIYDLSLMMFRDMVYYNLSIRERIQADLQQSINIIRTNGNNVDNIDTLTYFKTLIELCTRCSFIPRDTNKQLQPYLDIFETEFLNNATKHYKEQALSKISTDSAFDYIRWVNNAIVFELEYICTALLDNAMKLQAEHKIPTTLEKLRRMLLTELFLNHFEAIVSNKQTGLAYMIESDKVADIKTLVCLAKLVQQYVPTSDNGKKQVESDYGMLVTIRDIVIKSIIAMHDTTNDTTTTVVENGGAGESRSNHEVFVESISSIKSKFDRILDESFGNDSMFTNAINRAYNQIVNSNARSPEFISLFIDETIKNPKKLSNEEIEEKLNRIVSLCAYVSEKDVFEKYYKTHLAKRLIGISRSTSNSSRTTGSDTNEDIEQFMIVKLAATFSSQFASRLSGMFKDMAVSNDLTTEFKQYRHTTSSTTAATDFNATVLTSVFWPSNKHVHACILPQDAMDCMKEFETFYKLKYSGRRLVWQHNLSTGDLRMRVGGKTYEINVGAYQMSVLMLFNEYSTLTFKQICEYTGIPDSTLKQILLSLCAIKTARFLIKSPAVNEFTDSDLFTFNDKFVSKLLKFKVRSVTASKETDHERKETLAQVNETRKFQIDAVIVRIMKSRKTSTVTQLIGETTQQLAVRFTPKPVDVKKRIDDLIEREYLERDSDDTKVLKYLA